MVATSVGKGRKGDRVDVTCCSDIGMKKRAGRVSLKDQYTFSILVHGGVWRCC